MAISSKQIIARLHLWLGLASGLIVFVVSLSGCLYVFEQELQALVYRDQWYVARQERPQLSAGQLLARVARAYPETKIQRLFQRHDPPDATVIHSAQVMLKDKRQLSVDPYTGAVLGVRNLKTDFFALTREFHTSLMLGKTGSHIIGGAVLVYIFLLLSGLVLWWPRYRATISRATLSRATISRTALKQKFTIKWRARWRRVNYDLHSVGGFYALLLLLLIAMTGLIWSFEWWENGLYRLAGSPPRDRSTPKSTYQAGAGTYPVDRAYATVLALEAGHRAQVGDPTESYVILPADSVGALRVQIRYDENAFYRKYNTFFFDQYTGNVLKGKRFSDFSAGDKARGAAYDLHTGGWLGLPGKVLAFLASLFSASLPVTGFLLWRGRRKKACQTLETPVQKRSWQRRSLRQPV